MNKFSRLLNVFVAVVMVMALMAANQPVKAQTGTIGGRDKSGNSSAPFVPGQVVVGFVGGKTLSTYSTQAAGLASALGGEVSGVTASGGALLNFPPDADVQSLVESLNGKEGVKFAEPNYIMNIPDLVQTESVNHDYVLQMIPKNSRVFTEGKSLEAVSVAAMQAMLTKTGNTIKATYPNDPELYYNNGWSSVGADIVWPNTTASATVCEIDTGVDYSHPDLAGKIIKGYDYVNDDSDPMDDNGHGTHVAGIIAADQNNKIGIAGVSTGKVVAVKVLDAQGYGTSFDVARGITYCANRTDIKVISMSLGGSADSDMIYYAVQYATNSLTDTPPGKGKLIIAAAGNTGADIKSYPGAYSDTTLFPEYTNKVLSVAASGSLVEDGNGGYYVDNSCMADYSSYGSWVSVIAPGTDIYSTLPWDKPFYLNFYYGYNTRYDSLSGTSMATPFVAATAARRWGYKPLETNAQIGTDVLTIPDNSAFGDGSCWPASMDGKPFANVASELDRFALEAEAGDAVAGLPLNGATISVYQGTTLRGSAVISPYTYKEQFDVEPGRIYTSYLPYTDILNLLAGSGYVTKVSKTGYTNGAQQAFQQRGAFGMYTGGFYWYAGLALVPPLSSKFELVAGWLNWYRSDYATNYAGDTTDLDSNVWIPWAPNPLDSSQDRPFIVGAEGYSYNLYEGDSTGEDGAFPFARLQREGGYLDPSPIETIVIDSRKAHAPLAANSAMPYYPGLYANVITDYGQTIDQDGDGCGNNYGSNYNPNYDNTCGGVGTPGIPLLGVYVTPYVYVWKDGVIKYFSGMANANGGAPYNAYDACNAPEWGAVAVNTDYVNGPVQYYAPDSGQFCGSGIGPYANLPGADNRANMRIWLNK